MLKAYLSTMMQGCGGSSPHYTVNWKFSRRFYFHKTSHMRSFVKIKSSQIGEIALSFTDFGKSRPCRDYSMSQICVLTLFAKMKFSRNFPNLQYINCGNFF